MIRATCLEPLEALKFRLRIEKPFLASLAESKLSLSLKSADSKRRTHSTLGTFGEFALYSNIHKEEGKQLDSSSVDRVLQLSSADMVACSLLIHRTIWP